jgi:hypothetical protein
MSASEELTPAEDPKLAVLAIEIAEGLQAIEVHWQATLAHAIQVGEKLIEAKSLVRHGQWLPWLKANFDGDRKTASNYMRLAGNGERVAHLPSVREALALLAAPPPDPWKPFWEVVALIHQVDERLRVHPDPWNLPPSSIEMIARDASEMATFFASIADGPRSAEVQS